MSSTDFIKDLLKHIGHEVGVDYLGYELGAWAQFQTYQTVGALLLTCADETERENAEAFQSGFVDLMLPRITTGHQAPFRLTNLGGRYEPGALAIAEAHFDLERPKDTAKLMVAKVNSHVGIQDGPTFGSLKRYGEPCTACGAISAVLKSQHQNLPFAQELEATLGTHHLNHLRQLHQTEQDGQSYLFAAIVNSLLQTRRLVSEILNHASTTLTHYLVMSCVTLNQYSTDTEVVCGIHWIERAETVIKHDAWALPLDPSKLALISTRRPLQVGVIS